MKNKKGFIATGLIYSFFLIFLTLFLTTITSHIKNKVSLSYIEDGIKESLNAHKTVRDFMPGDLIYFVDDCDSVDENTFATDLSKAQVVASVITNETKEDEEAGICGDDISECLILYSYLLDSNNTNAVTYNDIKNDISTGYLNGTYINKILYNFDTDGGNKKSYIIDTNKYVSLDITLECISGDEIFCNDYGKIVDNGDNTKYRKRTVKTFNDNKIERCSVEDAMGVIYVKE